MDKLEKLAIVNFFNFEDYSYGKLTVKEGVLYRQDVVVAVHMGQFIYLNTDFYSKVVGKVQDMVKNYKTHMNIKSIDGEDIKMHIPR